TNNYTLLDGAQFAGTGLFSQTGGTFTLDGTLLASSFLWSGGNWNAANNSGLTTTIGPNTVLNLTAANDSARDFNGRAIVNNGTVNWGSAYIRGGNGSTFVNNGTFNDTQTQGWTIHNPNFGGTAGTFTFANNGSVSVLHGALQFRAGGTLAPAGSISAASGANVYFTNGYTVNNGSSL